MSDHERISVYLDQSILGFVSDSSLPLDRIGGVDWIYSYEHFHEIQRGNNRSFLNALKKLKARRMEMQLDGNWQFTGKANIHPFECPIESFKRYQENAISGNSLDGLFTPLIARLYGADNQDDVVQLPELLRKEIRLLLEDGSVSLTMEGRTERVASEMDVLIDKELSQIQSLEAMRKSLGTAKGRAGSVKGDNPILEIWNLIKDRYSNVSIDEFFGFDTKFKQDYNVWPTYLGIIGCYSVLNSIGYRTDKGIARTSTTPNILSDGTHVANAAFCSAFVSADSRMCDKAKAIYRYRDIGTEIFQLVENNDRYPPAS